MRDRLTDRRPSETLGFVHNEPNGMKTELTATVGKYLDGRIGEVFINAKKNDSMMGLLCHDAAVLISLALQYGVPLAEMKQAVARENEAGHPQSWIGSVLDLLVHVETQGG